MSLPSSPSRRTFVIADAAGAPDPAMLATVAAAGAEHVVENTGATRLYCLTTMVPNEGFAELIRGGVVDRLDDEDLRILS